MEFEKNDLTEWLEETIGYLFEHKPMTMAMTALMEDGNVMTAYYKANATDKALFVHNIQSDIIIDIVAQNVNTILGGMPDFDAEGTEDDAQ